jgi:protein required for attachment to host cells
MPHADKPNRLVLVCDGAKALLLADSGIAPKPRLKVLETISAPSAPTSELGTDRPGRVHESKGASRSAVETTDLHALAEADFLKRLAGRLAELVQDGAGRILIVAPPKALGTLRDALSAQVKAAVDGELAKDLVKLPVEEIERHIAA